MASKSIYTDLDLHGNAVLNGLMASAPAWVAGRQLGGALVWDAVESGLFRVRQDIANSQVRPGLNANNYTRVQPLDWVPLTANELPAAHASQAGKSLRENVLYLFGLLGTPTTDTGEYEASDYESTDYLT